METWFLYIIRCRDQSLYTGITTDVSRRLAMHKSGTGARYLRGRGPLHLVLQYKVGSHALALKVERSIKRQSKATKERLVADGIHA